MLRGLLTRLSHLISLERLSRTRPSQNKALNDSILCMSAIKQGDGLFLWPVWRRLLPACSVSVELTGGCQNVHDWQEGEFVDAYKKKLVAGANRSVQFSKTLPVFSRCYTKMALKDPSQNPHRSKTCFGRHHFWRFTTLFKQTARNRQACLLNPSSG